MTVSFTISTEYDYNPSWTKYIVEIKLKLSCSDGGKLLQDFQSNSFLMEEELATEWGYFDGYAARERIIHVKDEDLGALVLKADADVALIKAGIMAVVTTNREKMEACKGLGFSETFFI